MKVTIYTINDCKFSQAEKEYLKNNNIAFEEKNLETNRDYLTEMLKVSDNFAGTPVTKVEKDGGEIIILKGFTQDEFAKALNLSISEVATPSTEPPVSQPASTPTPPMPQVPSPVPPVVQVSTIPVQTVADVSANKPDMTIESLSEPAVSTQPVTNANPPEPVMPPMPSEPAAPMSITPNEVPVNPLENQEVGPISLDVNDQTPAPMGVQPSGLDSVLQNLQTQVQAGVPPTNTPPKS